MIKDWEVCFKKREQHGQRTGGENELSALGELQRILGRRERRGEDGEGVRGCVTKGLGGNAEVKILVKALGGTEVFGAGREYPRVHLFKERYSSPGSSQGNGAFLSPLPIKMTQDSGSEKSSSGFQSHFHTPGPQHLPPL